jgi:hypothetical protein
MESLGFHDFASRYRASIASGSNLEGALLGLMDTGTRDDSSVVLSFADTGPARVRRAAVLAAMRLLKRLNSSLPAPSHASVRSRCESCRRATGGQRWCGHCVSDMNPKSRSNVASLMFCRTGCTYRHPYTSSHPSPNAANSFTVSTS